MPRVLDYNATVTRRDEITDGLAVFHVELDEPLEPKPELGAPFLAGQYVTIGMNRPSDDPDDTRPVSVLRPMTVASAPEEPGALQFFVRLIDKPDARLPLTHLMWASSVGERMYVRPSATGHFTVPDTLGLQSDTNALMVAEGTGLAPFISMLRSARAQDPEARLDRWGLLYGVSNPAFLGYDSELLALAADAGLRYLPTVARPHEAPDWSGSLGRLPDLLGDDRVAETEAELGIELRPSQTKVLVCGLGPTIAGTIHALLPRGFLPGHRRLKSLLDAKELDPSLFYEQYDTAPLFDLKDEKVANELRERWRPPS